MRQLFKIAFCASMVFYFTGCEEVLEDETPDVREYLEFKVEGKTFESSSIANQCRALTFNFFTKPYLDLSPGYMLMKSENCVDSASLTFTFQGVTQEYTGTSSLEFPEFADSFVPVYREGNTIYNRLLDGTIHIEEFSGSHKKESGILRGTFQLRLTDYEKTDTLNITEGRFNFIIAQKLD